MQLVLRTVAVHAPGDHLLYPGPVEPMALVAARMPLVFCSGACQPVRLHKAPQVRRAGADGS